MIKNIMFSKTRYQNYKKKVSNQEKKLAVQLNYKLVIKKIYLSKKTVTSN